jgi:hypothetical protein
MIEQYAGTYRGFSPTDESPVVRGELELVIDASASTIKVRMATGLELLEDEVSFSEARPLEKEEIASIYCEGSDYPARSSGFKLAGRAYVFLENPGEGEMALLVRGGLGDLLGPTMLFGPAQLEQGLFEKAIAEIEKSFGKPCVPQIKYEGRMPPEYYQTK